MTPHPARNHGGLSCRPCGAARAVLIFHRLCHVVKKAVGGGGGRPRQRLWWAAGAAGVAGLESGMVRTAGRPPALQRPGWVPALGVTATGRRGGHQHAQFGRMPQPGVGRLLVARRGVEGDAWHAVQVRCRRLWQCNASLRGPSA